MSGVSRTFAVAEGDDLACYEQFIHTTARHLNIETETDKQTDRQTDRQTDKRTNNGQIGGQTNKQIERPTLASLRPC